MSLAFGQATASPSDSAPGRELALHNLHTGETIDVIYWRTGNYDSAAIAALDKFFRDYRTGAIKQMDLRLFDLLHQLRETLGESQPFDLISGYRSPATNAYLVAHSKGVSRHSMHVQGKAADIRAPGVPLTKLRDTAKALHLGGVGYYPASDFVHVDTGRVRYW